MRRKVMKTVAAVVLVSPFLGTIVNAHTHTQTASAPVVQHVELRKFPWPYRAMIAIDSDADHTDLRKFNEVHEFLNTYSHTPMGQGLGLDISDSFFLHNGSNINSKIDYNGATVKDEMTMFLGTSSVPSEYAPILLSYMRHGWIDTFHSAGDYSTKSGRQTAFTRVQEVEAMNFLQKEKAPIILDFTDHGNTANVANFGFWHPWGVTSTEQGDNPRSPYYIVPLLRKEGVKFVWPDEFNSAFAETSMIYPVRLRDGTIMWGFHRYTGSRPDERFAQWNPYELFRELSVPHLRLLLKLGDYAVVATHLEGNADHQVLPDSAIHALTYLASLQKSGQVLVARTSRLLWYNLVHQGVLFHASSVGGLTYIDVTEVRDPVDGNFRPVWQQLRGLTWFVRSPQQTRILVNGVPVPITDTVRAAGVIGVSWYPKDTTNWAVTLNTSRYQHLRQKMVSRDENTKSRTVVQHHDQAGTGA